MLVVLIVQKPRKTGYKCDGKVVLPAEALQTCTDFGVHVLCACVHESRYSWVGLEGGNS